MTEVRDQELRRFIRLYIINAIFTLLWFGSPILVTVVSFTAYTKWEHKELTPSVAFTAMAVFILLRVPLNLLPDMITEFLEALVSIKRIEAFLNEAEIRKYSIQAKEDAPANTHNNGHTNGHTNGLALNPGMVPHQIQTTGAIGFTSATFRWHTKAFATHLINQVDSCPNSNTGAFMLKNITLNFPVGKLSLICKYRFYFLLNSKMKQQGRKLTWSVVHYRRLYGVWQDFIADGTFGRNGFDVRNCELATVDFQDCQSHYWLHSRGCCIRVPISMVTTS
jgi:hypothetical protein